jgi:thiol:disulfide interchange protein
MKKGILTIILVLASVFLLFGCTAPVTQNDTTTQASTSDSMQENNNLEVSQNNEVNNIDNEVVQDNQTVSLSGYQPITEAAYNQAKEEGKVIFLEFYANWCPGCQRQKPINEGTFESSELPENAVGFQVNYKDSETDTFEESLAREFGITFQHTRIILNSDGSVASRTTGEQSEEEIIASLSSAN